jgi:tetratricopeptide (TPR) repeat protein
VSFEECLRIQLAAGSPALINRARVGLAQVLVALDRTKEARSMADEIIQFSTTHNDRRSEHFGWHYLADCALIEQSYEESLELYKKSLELVTDSVTRSKSVLRSRVWRCRCRRSAARVERSCSRLRSMRKCIGSVPDVHVRFWDALTDRHFGAAKIDLGEEAYGLAWSEGAAVPFERAVEMALGAGPRE